MAKSVRATLPSSCPPELERAFYELDWTGFSRIIRDRNVKLVHIMHSFKEDHVVACHMLACVFASSIHGHRMPCIAPSKDRLSA